MTRYNSQKKKAIRRLQGTIPGARYSTARAILLNRQPPVPTSANPPNGDNDDPTWISDAKASLSAALSAVEWDFANKLVRVVEHDPKDRPITREIKTANEFLAYLAEEAFQGYNQSAPRDSGEWVFEFDGWDLAEEMLQDECEEQMTEIGWW